MDLKIAEEPNPLFTEEDGRSILFNHFHSLVGPSVKVSQLASERDTVFYVKVAGNGEEGNKKLILKIANPLEPANESDLQIGVLLHLSETLNHSLFPRSSPPSSSSLISPPPLNTQKPLEATEPSAFSGSHTFQVESPQDGRKSHVRLLTFVDGCTLRSTLEKRSSSRNLRFRLGEALARLDIGLRGFVHCSLATRVLYWDIAHSDKLVPLFEFLQDEEVRILVSHEVELFRREVKPKLKFLRHQTIFNDFNPDNVLISENSDFVSGIIDFGDVVQGTLAAEVATGAAYFFFSCIENSPIETPIEDICDFLGGYVSLLPLEREEVNLLFDLIKMRFVITILICSWRASLHPTNSDYILRWYFKALAQLHRLKSFDRASVTQQFLEACSLYPVEKEPRAHATNDSLLERRHRVLPPSYRLFYEPSPVTIMKGTGCELFDEEGNLFLDFYNNVASVGHCHPNVVTTVCSQLHQINTHTRYLHPAIVELSETLTGLLPSPLSKCYYTCSGSEANDLAYRLACSHVLCPKGVFSGVICSSYAYHGGTFVTSEFTPAYLLPMNQAIPPHIELIDFPSLVQQSKLDQQGANDAAKEAIKQSAAALRARGIPPSMLILDCGLTSDGVYPLTKELLKSVILSCREEGMLFVADEVQMGFARTGGDSFWGFANILSDNSKEGSEDLGSFVPDLVTMGKPMGNGFPVGCVVTRSEIASQFAESTKYFNTFGGNPVAAQACFAVIQTIQKENLKRNCSEMGQYLHKKLVKIQKEFRDQVVEVRGIGLLFGLEMCDEESAGKIVFELRRQSILVSTSGKFSHCLKIRPPLCVSVSQIDKFCECLEIALQLLKKK